MSTRQLPFSSSGSTTSIMNSVNRHRERYVACVLTPHEIYHRLEYPAFRVTTNSLNPAAIAASCAQRNRSACDFHTLPTLGQRC